MVCRTSEKGLVVRIVTERSAADRAGLKRGDVILTLQDKKVTTTDELIEILTNYKPSEKVKLSISRGEDSLDVETFLGKRPDSLDDQNDKWGGGPFSDRRYGIPKSHSA